MSGCLDGLLGHEDGLVGVQSAMLQVASLRGVLMVQLFLLWGLTANNSHEAENSSQPVIEIPTISAHNMSCVHWLGSPYKPGLLKGDTKRQLNKSLDKSSRSFHRQRARFCLLQPLLLIVFYFRATSEGV